MPNFTGVAKTSDYTNPSATSYHTGLVMVGNGSYIIKSTANALTAFAGGGQANATALPAQVNRVTTVATAADSVVLPTAVAGQEITVINAAAANAMNVFPLSGQSINALSANAAFSVAANKVCVFTCAVNGIWNTNLSA